MAVSWGKVTVTKPNPTPRNAAMLLEIITLYCVCDEYFKQSGHQDNPQAQMTSAEVMTTALVAAWFFAGNLRTACAFLKEAGHIPAMLEESRFNRRLHRIAPAHWQGVLSLLAARDGADTFAIDSYPVAACHLKRASRCRLYQDAGKAYFGYCAAKEEYFYGLKAHTVVTASGRPVEVLLLCGCSADLTGMKEMALALPEGATLYADKAYTDYAYEDQLQADHKIALLPVRKRNLKRQHAEEVAKELSRARKRIETTFSQISARLARHIHAVTAACFESKILATFVAYAILGVAS
jgi:Transposase DDE domain